MTYSEEQYDALLAVCRSYRNDYENAFERIKAQQQEINALKAENTNLTVENNVLQSEKENLMRTLKEGAEEIKSLSDNYDPFWFCSFGGCEGVCKECKDHCEKSIFVQERKETAKEILILLGKGFDETKMTEFKNLPWYKLFCRELKQRYDISLS